MNQRLKELRNIMSSNKWDMVFIPCSDPHLSEYIPERWKTLAWISGFTGSTGNGIVTKDFAGVWTDSRYFIQAEEQMRNTEFTFVKLLIPHTPEYIQWICDTLPSGSTVALVGSVVSFNMFQLMNENFSRKGIKLIAVDDFWGKIWNDRPAIPGNKIFEHELKYSGRSRTEKINEIRSELKKNECDAHVVSALDDIAWTLNLRGGDIKYNPLFLAFLYIDFDRVVLFANLDSIDSELKNKLQQEKIILAGYETINTFLSGVKNVKRLLIDGRKTTIALSQALSQTITVVNEINPAIKLKAIKNKIEIENLRSTMIKDGISMVKFFIWMEESIGKEKLTEQIIVDKILEFRKMHPDFTEPSFATIVGYKAHAALPHYAPSPETDCELNQDGILLIDSGGQFYGGTTDITRVVSFGNLKSGEKNDYTAVLKGLIALTTVIFPKGATSASLDAIARRPIWDAGKHYSHGTGHGVGYFLGVHEGPQAFGGGATALPSTIMQTGMVTTIEPGIYNVGEYGVRLENVVLTVPHKTINGLEFLCFETLTLCPFETPLINKEMLSKQEIDWLNNYHQWVYNTLALHLNKKECEWLKGKTKSI